MRITHTVPDYFPSQGGIETLVRSIVRRTKTKTAWQSSVVVPAFRFDGTQAQGSDGPFSDTVDGCEVLRLPVEPDPSKLAPRETVRLFSWCRQTLQNFQPDLVHSHGITVLTVPMATTAERLGIPLLWHVHGGLPEDCPKVLLQLLRETRHILAPSNFVREDIIRAAGRTFPIHVIHNGIETKVKTPEVPRDNLKRRTILMVGRLEFNKGFHIGLRATAPLLHSQDLTLRIIGVGPELQRLRKLAEELNVASRVEFSGELLHTEALEEIARSFVLIVPSTQIEGFGLVAAEAGMLGIPVVASNVGGLPEVVINGQTGQIVDIGNEVAVRKAVQRYLENPSLGELHGKTAQNHVRKHFDISVFFNTLTKLYRDIPMKTA